MGVGREQAGGAGAGSDENGTDEPAGQWPESHGGQRRSKAAVLIGRPEKAGYAFYVHDTGKGIPAEELSRITEAFYMVDKSRSRKAGGIGMGLALCQKIAEIHRANLVIESVVGQGTKISVVFQEETDE